MINLISPEHKRDIRAARINVILVQYSAMLVILLLVIGAIYTLGFWLVMQDKLAVNEKLRSQSEQAATFAAVEKEAAQFRTNLLIAKQIIGNGKSYSTFLTTVASTMPSGTILTNLAIGGQSVAATQNGLTIDARTVSYAKVLELKTKLEQSSLFEDVNIVSASRPDDLAGLSGLTAKYPFEASFNVKLSAQKAPGS